MMMFTLLIVMLLPHAVCDAQTVNCGIWHPQFVHHKYYYPGDHIIGGIIFQNIFLLIRNTFNQRPSQPLLTRMLIQSYQHVLAVEFAVKEINEHQQLLPNITLGFDIYDSYVEARWTYQAILRLISPKDRLVPNYKCDNQRTLMAVIEELISDVSNEIPEVLGRYKIPQLLYGSAVVSADKNQAPSIFRVEPNEIRQYSGILQLLLHFKWTWIGFIAADEKSLEWFMDIVFQTFSNYGICFAVRESFPALGDAKNMDKLLSKFYKIVNYKINVWVIYGDIRSMMWLGWLLFTQRENKNHTPRGKVWILTAQMQLKYTASYPNWDSQKFHGSLSFVTHFRELQGFRSFLRSRNLSSSKEDGFIRDFWENAFRCTLSSSPLGPTESAACNGEERLERLPENSFPMSTTSQSYTIYNAVYAVAHALHAMYMSTSKKWAKMEGEKGTLHDQQPWQLHHFLKTVSFNNSAGDWISFDQKGELIVGFDIINWVRLPNETFLKVKVATMSHQASAITIDKNAIVWNSWFNQAQPLSMCNDKCHPGYSKEKREGKPFCCYNCIPCPEGMVAEMDDMADCITCPNDHYPNKDRTSCIPKIVVFLSYEEPLGIGLAICALSFALVTALVLSLFIKHHNSPIVKVNNRSLTYTILVSLLLGFLCPLLHIGRPKKVTCILRQMIFGVTFSIAVASVLVKTFTVVIAFRATRPGSTLKNWLGKRLAYSVFLPCIIIEAVICTLQLTISPTFPDADMISRTQEIILQCNASLPIFFYFELAYLELLAVVNFIVAFLARKLPDAFNEAKFVTFSMFAYCCFWMIFLLTCMRSKGKDMVAVEIFSITASGAALLVFMFFPKCYIILWRPQLNSREQIRKQKC